MAFEWFKRYWMTVKFETINANVPTIKTVYGYDAFIFEETIYFIK